MSILINKETRVICQGITGGAGSFHSKSCKEYGTKMVGGVSPGKAGQNIEGIPIFNTVSDAVHQTRATATMIFVPAPYAADAVLEAVAANLKVIVCITEGVPVLDMARVKQEILKKQSATAPSAELGDGGNRSARAGEKIWLIGPNCPGIITPDECKIGIMPGYIHKKNSDNPKMGQVGIVSRSGTLTYEAVWQLTALGIGQSTVIGIGGDPILGTGFIDALEAFEKDPDTSAVMMIGEIGGSQEEEAAKYFKEKMTKPVIGFIAGQTAPPGKRMGHAGAIIESGSGGTAQGKIAAMKALDIQVAPSPAEIGVTVKKVLEQSH